MSKRLSKYIASFEYFARFLIVLPAKSGNISIAIFGAPVGISVSTRIVQKLFKTTQSKRKRI